MAKKKKEDKKEKGIVVEGTVEEALPNAMFRVKLDTGHEVLAHVSGKMRMHFIKLKKCAKNAELSKEMEE